MPRRIQKAEHRQKGLTLLELMLAVAIVLILATLISASFQRIRERAESIQCAANLKSLVIATSGYLQDHRQWPQVLVPANSPDYTKQWHEALKPYGIQENAWVCPTIQRKVGKPDLTKEKNRRMDYFPTNFDANESSPRKWSTQPWFIEVANSHGNGALLIFMDGSIRPMNEFSKKLPKH